MRDREFRRSVLQSLGASDAVADEILVYTENVFAVDPPSLDGVPEDEPFVGAWRTYAAEARDIGAFKCLQKRLIQLRFPIAQGMSRTPAYLAATRRGELPPDGQGLRLAEPDGLQIQIHPSAAGHIPLLITKNRSDFVTLVRALARRNEPVPVPDSMGACMVAGYNNWDRVLTHRREWQQDHPRKPWDREFASLIQRKELYQDRFILLSDGPYSGVSAEAMGLPDDVWRVASLIIRREHECAHYYTRRIFGSMRNNLFDELIADYMGILEVAGCFRADWFLRFMGLEDFPHYRRGGRFENYTSGLSTAASRVLHRLTVDAARTLESTTGSNIRDMAGSDTDRSLLLRQLATRTLEEIAGRGLELDHHIGE